MSDVFIAGMRVKTSGEQAIANYVWDTGTLAWVPQTASGGSGPSSDVTVTNTSLAVTQAGVWNINTITSLPLPTGAATETTLTTLTTPVRASNSAFTDGDNGLFVLGKRRDSDTTLVADGDYCGFNFDEVGRLKVATQPGTVAATTGNITGSGQTIPVNIERASNITISMVATSLTGHNITFEYSNNSTNGTDGNWYVVQVVRSNANTVETTSGVLTATPAYGWEASVNAYKWFRIRATAHTGGTASYTLLPGAYATEPIPAVQVTGTQPVSGSLTSAGTTTNTPATPTASIINSAATTNGTVVKASAGTLYMINVSNNGAAAAYLKLHNSTTITVGTTAVAFWRVVPAGSSVEIDFGAQGMRFGTGICMSITGAVADTDTTAVAAGQVKVLTSYI